MRWALALGLLLLLAPALAGQSLALVAPEKAPATLHFHMQGFQDFAINTQPAEFGGWEMGSGLGAHSLSCLPDTPVTGFENAYHTYYGYSTASYVEYGFEEDGRARLWPERQLGYDTVLDAGLPPVLHWYLETATSAQSDTPSPPQVIPEVVVEATLRVSDSVSVDDKAYDTGPVIASGRSPPALLAAEFSQGVEHLMVDEHHVYHFTLPLELEEAQIGTKGYTLRVDVYVDDPVCETGGSMASTVQPYGDAVHRPRLETGVLDPVRIDSLQPSFNGSKVVVTASTQSVWGNYDVDEGDLSLALEGPGMDVDLQPAKVVQRTHEHQHHADPVEVTWEFDRSGLADGLYLLTFRAANDQHTAEAVATAAVRLGPDQAFAAGEELTPAREAPGVPAAALLLALAVLGLAAARRR